METIDPETVDITKLLNTLQAKADNAYCDYIGLCSKDECLGYEAKMHRGIFGEPELKAHKDAAKRLGQHVALQEVVNMIRELSR